MVRFALASLLLGAATAQTVEVDPVGRQLFEKIPSLMERATERFLQIMDDVTTETPPSPSLAPKGQVCTDPGLASFTGSLDANTRNVLSTMVKYDGVVTALEQYAAEGITIGSTTALIAEASDAAASGATIEDGMSGDTDFPHGNLKPIATGGERSVCADSFHGKITGTPDGLGAYLSDDNTVRVVVQSEGYGPLRYESYPVHVNDGAATFGGSHIQYVDYDRESFANFMDSSEPASSMVTGFGEMIETVYNLKGEKVQSRKGKAENLVGAHYSNTNENGTYAMWKFPAETDWFFQSFCSSHLEQKHQWGENLGVEDDIFITNEEWANFALDKTFVGLSSHALDVQTKSLHAIGAFTMGGFEKSVELNPTSSDYVIFAVSGYNGNFDNGGIVPGQTFIPQNVLDLRNAQYGPRADGKDYVWTKDIVPYRIYVGVKGKLEDGSDAPQDDFLARNGLKYGQLYGFAIDMRNETDATGPTAGVFRDAWHKTATNGDMIPGKWMAQEWRWNGKVRDYQHDGSWDYQNPPPGTGAGSDLEGYMWWVSRGIDKGGCKTEHISPDPRSGRTAFIQGSTCGYFGHLYVNDVADALAAANGGLPTVFDGSYYAYQGETDITGQIELNGKGQLTEGRDATRNWDNTAGEGKVTFEDIDGLEVFADGDKLYAVIQEDSGNKLGDRVFITSPLEHEADGNDLTYYFVAMSGGKENSRQVAGVGIPKGVACFDGEKYESNAHEFSGVFDASGLVRKDETGSFAMSAADTGFAKRTNDALVSINEKNILMNLQAGNYRCGVMEAFQTDRGGQWLMYRPNIPTNDVISPAGGN